MSDITLENLDAKIEALRADMNVGFTKAFEQTQGGFNDHRAYAEFLVERLNKQMTERFTRVDHRFDAMEQRFDGMEQRFDGMEQRFDRLEGRFDRMERRFDRMEGRFDRLEALIKGRPAPRKPRRSRP